MREEEREREGERGEERKERKKRERPAAVVSSMALGFEKILKSMLALGYETV